MNFSFYFIFSFSEQNKKENRLKVGLTELISNCMLINISQTRKLSLKCIINFCKTFSVCFLNYRVNGFPNHHREFATVLDMIHRACLFGITFFRFHLILFQHGFLLLFFLPINQKKTLYYIDY